MTNQMTNQEAVHAKVQITSWLMRVPEGQVPVAFLVVPGVKLLGVTYADGCSQMHDLDEGTSGPPADGPVPAIAIAALVASGLAYGLVWPEGIAELPSDARWAYHRLTEALEDGMDPLRSVHFAEAVLQSR